MGDHGSEAARSAGDRGDEAFRALADPTRRRMLDLLAERGTLSVGELAAEFPDLVFSGISKHLMALRAAGLVTATKQGRKQLYRIDEAGFTAALAPWVARYQAYWPTALATLRTLAESPENPAPPR
ncbi:metalloregulator ArsR/SmtB family transcription factor [Actinocatenispora sera]|uniref:ArsR/SmtB family transcription factor n=1 Tax=Actinocatenispora sera TaxID=390989 RepID=UPI0033D356C1